MTNASLKRTAVKSAPVFHGPEVWARVKAGYMARLSCAECERRFGPLANTIRARARREDWKTEREPHLITGLEPPAEAAHLRPANPPDAVQIAQAALNSAVRALEAGRPSEAVALIKAGETVGQFADVVQRLAERRAPASPGGPIRWRPPNPHVDPLEFAGAGEEASRNQGVDP